MKVIEGVVPEEKHWRVLIMLPPGRGLGKTGLLGKALARANNGELILAVIVTDTSKPQLAAAREIITQIKKDSSGNGRIYPLIVQNTAYDKDFVHFVQTLGIDLLLTYADGPSWQNLNKISCAVGIVRGDIAPDVDMETADQNQLKRIVVPTSGGPNTAHALGFLLPLTPGIEVQALYVAPAHLGPNEEALGRARLRQLLNLIDAGDRIQTKLITSPSVIRGIVDAADQDCDLVVIGASRESSLDKVLFGNIPDAVVRQSHKPIVIVRQPKKRMDDILGALSWQMENFRVRLNLQQRTEVYARIRRSARPDADFFILIALSAMIAALGLIINSPAVVIGAMLVAPLMSPIIGAGLAVVLGDTRFLRLSLGAVMRGVLLAVFVSALAGLVRLHQPLTPELLARTQPTLIDLAIALFSGMAGAYALSHSDAAGALPGVAIAAALVPPLSTIGITLITGHFQESLGAALLFLTNFVAISSATALTFLILGFRPTPAQKARREVQVRSVRVAMLLVVIVALLLTVFTYQLAQDAALEADTRELVSKSVVEVTGAWVESPQDLLIEGDITNSKAPLTMNLTVRSTRDIPHRKVEELQDAISIELQREVGLTMTVIKVTELDPKVPPTQTPTPVPTNTATPGPTPTFTPTFTPTPMPTDTLTPDPTDTPTPVPTDTVTPVTTDTPVPSPTPQTAVVTTPYGLNLRAEPERAAEILAFLPPESIVVLLDGRETADNLVWQQVEADGLVGWVSNEFLAPN